MAHSSIGTPSPLARLRLLVSTRFQILFHRPSGLLLTVPSRYWFTIGQKTYLALPHSRGGFLQAFPRPVVLRNNDRRSIVRFAYGAVTRSGRPLETVLLQTRALIGLSSSRISRDPTSLSCNPHDATAYTFIHPAAAQSCDQTQSGEPRHAFRLIPFRSPLLGESS